MSPDERAALSERDIAALIKQYRAAEARIIATFDEATDFGQARRAEQLAQIDQILADLGKSTGEWLDGNTPTAYQHGTEDAIKQLTALKVGIKDNDTMSLIDRRAVAALVSETQAAFATAMTTVGRTANRTLSAAARQAIQDELAQGRILGSTRREVSTRIKAQMRAEGITALVDKGGRQWTLSRYAEMLARTKMVEARNTGLGNKMVSNGYDLVEVSDHMSSHQACAYYEGKILSLTGATPGYPSVDSAKAGGLFHPYCRHQINAIRLDFAAMTKAYDPRTGEYVQPFASNPPHPPRVKLVPPAIVGKNAKLVATPEMSVIRGKNVTMSAAGKIKTYALTDIESEFVNKIGLEIKTSDGAVLKPGGKRDPNVRGYYSRSHNVMMMRTVDTDSDVQTFYHELGHALDFSAHKVLDQFTGNIEDLPQMARAIRQDKNAVVATRMIRDKLGQGYRVAYDQAVLGARRKVYEATKIATGQKVYLQSRPSWLTYARGGPEVTADAYGQYRTQPAAFAKYAPNLYRVFKELGL